MITIRLREEDFLSHQWQFLNDWSRTLGLVGGLGSGKTVSFLYKALLCLTKRPGAIGKSNIGIGYPTYEMGKSLFFFPFCEILDECKINYTSNISNLLIKTDFGDLHIKSILYPERIVGETFTDAGIDEIDIIPKLKGMRAVNRFRERLRGRKDSQLFMVSSPEGFSTCYEVLQEKPNPGTKLIRAKTTDNIYLSQSYIDDLMSSYDEKMVNAYIRGEFVNLNGIQAYYAFSRDKHIRKVESPMANDILQIGIDFNVDPMTSVVGYWRGDTLHVFSEYYLRNSNTYQMADLIAINYPDRLLVIYPDCTGSARETNAYISDLEILARKGWQLRYKHGISQRRSLNITNGEFAHNRIIIDPTCVHLIADLEQVTTDQNGMIEKEKNTMLTHISDALRNIINLNKIKENDWRIA